MKLSRLVAMLVVVLAATAPRAFAQDAQEAATPSRGPVMPSYPAATGAATSAAADPAAPPPAPAAQPDDSIDLVGPTASQKAHAEAAAKAAADAEAAAKERAAAQKKADEEAAVRAKIEAEVRARMEAEAKARAEADAKAQAEAAERARVQAEADAQARAAAEAQARAQADADAKAHADADARAQAAARAQADAQAAADAKAAAQRAAAHPNAQPADDVLADPLPLPAVDNAPPAPAPAAAALPVPPPAPDEGSVDLVAAPTRRVITPGAPPPLPPPPAYQPAPAAPAAYAAPAPAYPAPAPAYPPPAPAYPQPAPTYAQPAPAPTYAQPAPAYAQPDPAATVTPGYVDAAAHMREVDAAAKQAQLCRTAKKKHRKGKALAEACNAPAPSEMALPAAAVADNRGDQLPLSPIDASSNRGVIVASPPPPASTAQPASYQTASVQPIDERAPGTRLASSASPVIAPSYSQPTLRPDPIDTRPSMAIPSDEDTRRSRSFRASEELTAGPSLINNQLTLGGDIVPDALVMAFMYRFTNDDSGASHHGLFLTAGGAPCDDSGSCSFRASGLFGFSPTGSNAFVVNNNGALKGDALSYSSIYAAANMKGRTDSGWGFDAGAQLQDLSMTFKQGSAAPVDGNASLTQLKLSAAGSVQSGGFEARLMFQGNAYLSGDTSATTGAPLRGVFFDQELSGLASAPQGVFAKLEGRYSFSFGLTAQASYGYLTYAGPQWANASVISARLAQQVSRFQFGVGLTEQLDSPSVMPAGAGLADYATLYFNGSVSASF